MPLILPKEKEKPWLDLSISETQIEEMMIPYDSKDMKAYPVVNKMSRLGYNTTDKTVTEPVKYADLPEIN